MHSRRVSCWWRPGWSSTSISSTGCRASSPESFLADLTTLAALGVSRDHLLQLARHRGARRSAEQSGTAPSISGRSWPGGRVSSRSRRKSLGYTQTRWHTFQADGVGGRRPTSGCPASTTVCTASNSVVGMSARARTSATRVYRNHPVHDPYIERIEQGSESGPRGLPLRRRRPSDPVRGRARSATANPLSRAEYGATFGHPIEDDFGPLLERLQRGRPSSTTTAKRWC